MRGLCRVWDWGGFGLGTRVVFEGFGLTGSWSMGVTGLSGLGHILYSKGENTLPRFRVQGLGFRLGAHRNPVRGRGLLKLRMLRSSCLYTFLLGVTCFSLGEWILEIRM